MLTTIFSTARTGSSTFLRGLDIKIWKPDDHPTPASLEYFNFLNPPNQKELVDKFHLRLMDKVNRNDEDIVIKVIVAQICDNLHIVDDIVKLSDKVYHTVRKDFQAQLKSCVYADATRQWHVRDNRPITVTEARVRNCHERLTRSIKTHSDIYAKHGGEVIVLEDREQRRYPNPPVITKDINWTTFDTASLFNI